MSHLFKHTRYFIHLGDQFCMTVLLWVVSLVRTNPPLSRVSTDSFELVKEAERTLCFGVPSFQP